MNQLVALLTWTMNICKKDHQMNTGVVLDIDPLMLKSMNNYVSLYIESLIRERERERE